MKKYNRIILFLVALLPFVYLYPYRPYGAWIAETSALVLVSVMFLFSNEEKSTDSFIGPVQITFLGLIFSAFLSKIVNSPSYDSILIIYVLYLFIGLFIAHYIYNLNDKNEVVYLIAKGLFWGGVVQFIFCISKMSGFFVIYSQWINGLPFWVPHFNVNRTPNGFMFQRNQFADYLFMSGAAACYLYAQTEIKKITFIGSIIAIGLAISLSMSRTALLYIAMGFAVVALLHFKGDDTKKFSKAFLWFLACCIVFQVLSPYLNKIMVEYFPLLTEGSGLKRLGAGVNDTRWPEWQKAWHTFLANPWFGTGVGTYAAASYQLGAQFPYKGGEIVYQLFAHCHNIFLQLLAETGILGGISLLFGTIAVVYGIIKNKLDIHAAFVLIALSTMFIHSQLEYPLWYASFFILFTILASTVKLDLYSYTSTARSGVKYIFPVFILVASIYGLYSVVKLIDLNNRYESEAYSEALVNESVSLGGNLLVEDMADFYTLAMLSLDDRNLDYKLYLSSKILKFRPHAEMIFRHAIFISYKNRPDEGAAIVKNILDQYPQFIGSFRESFASVQDDPRLDKIKTVLQHKY
ncbi:hypothetical protein HA050_13330 [Iodobacter sp. HSC-16F04]|uniref:Virulence factor membrane-bound polymerase C-terminal domain-containing protein n=1 Tax=Iodobacter violaceini TaxID=3044271 RepID=A0ABX0KYC0_9NEIS|nr:Wzy polymerase domain-containing protein [Iodobacter violacea]NHQ87094.1 hypothetical protein [Iodobacter violacea]